MKLLAVETASDACSCALLVGAETHERFELAPRRHAELALEMAASLLAEAQTALGALDAIAFGRGPGSFTGVRIAAGVAQGLAFGADLPVVAVSSLAALAQGVFRETAHRRVLAAVDARMGEIYWGAFEVGDEAPARPIGAEVVVPPEAVRAPPGGGWLGAGSAWAAHGALLATRLGDALVGVEPERLARARDVAAIAAHAHARGEGVAAELALPVYLRDRVVRTRGRSD